MGTLEKYIFLIEKFHFIIWNQIRYLQQQQKIKNGKMTNPNEMEQEEFMLKKLNVVCVLILLTVSYCLEMIDLFSHS